MKSALVAGLVVIFAVTAYTNAQSPVCPTNHVLVGSCTCQFQCPLTSCPLGYALNKPLCRCDKVCNIPCPFPKTLNKQLCRCECPPRPCLYGTIFDFDNCRCVQNIHNCVKLCNADERLDLDVCRCEKNYY